MNYLNLESLNMSELTTEEFLQYANDIKNVVEKSNVSDEGLTSVFNLYESALTEANNFSREDRKHPLSNEIDALRLLRDRKAASLITLTRGYKMGTTEATKPAAEIVVPVLEVFLNGFQKANNFVKSQRLKMLFAKMDTDSGLVAALQTLGLKGFLDEIRETESTLKSLVEQRRATQPVKSGLSNTSVFAEATVILRKLLNAIDTNVLVDKSGNYNSLVSELNATTAEYKKVIQIRKASRKQLLVKNATTPMAGTTGEVKNEVA